MSKESLISNIKDKLDNYYKIEKALIELLEEINGESDCDFYINSYGCKGLITSNKLGKEIKIDYEAVVAKSSNLEDIENTIIEVIRNGIN